MVMQGVGRAKRIVLLPGPMQIVQLAFFINKMASYRFYRPLDLLREYIHIPVSPLTPLRQTNSRLHHFIPLLLLAITMVSSATIYWPF